MSTSPRAIGRVGDTAAVTFSGLCLIHCIALPFAAASLPLLGTVSELELVHKVFAVLSLTASLAVIVGCRPVGRIFLAAAIVGNSAVLAGAFVERFEAHETAVTVIGASILAAAHLTRLIRRRREAYA